MYRILLKMKKMYNHEGWLKMVEQAKERGNSQIKSTRNSFLYQRRINDKITNHKQTLVHHL